MVLLPTNEEVLQFNTKVLEKLKLEVITIVATDTETKAEMVKVYWEKY